MSRQTQNIPCGTIDLDLVVDVMIKAKDLTDAETAVCEQKAQAAAHCAAADYVRGVLAARNVEAKV